MKSSMNAMKNEFTAEDLQLEKQLKGAVDKEVSKRGGYRPGAGRPRGSANPLTRRAESKEKTIKGRVLKHVEELVSAQISLAKGVSYLYKIKMRNVGGRRKAEHILVTDPEEIQKYLDGDISEEYYYITAERPDNRAIDSLLDRAFGKAGQKNTNDHNFNLNVITYGEKPKIASGDDIIRDVTPEDNNDSAQLQSENLSAGFPPSSSEV